MSLLNKLPGAARHHWWLATLVGGVLLLSGCEAFEGGHDHDRRGDYRDRPAGYRVERDRDYRDRDYRDRDYRDRDWDHR